MDMVVSCSLLTVPRFLNNGNGAVGLGPGKLRLMGRSIFTTPVDSLMKALCGLENEKELVAGVLDGNRDGVVELPFTAGTLLIFGGRQTIHRVTRVEGERPRRGR